MSESSIFCSCQSFFLALSFSAGDRTQVTLIKAAFEMVLLWWLCHSLETLLQGLFVSRERQKWILEKFFNYVAEYFDHFPQRPFDRVILLPTTRIPWIDQKGTIIDKLRMCKSWPPLFVLFSNFSITKQKFYWKVVRIKATALLCWKQCDQIGRFFALWATF